MTSKGVYSTEWAALLRATLQAATDGRAQLVTRGRLASEGWYYVCEDSPTARVNFNVVYVVDVTTGPAHPQNSTQEV